MTFSLQEVQAKLDEETEKKHDLLPSSFVVFRSLRSSSVAAQVNWDHSPQTVDVLSAPELTSVLWKNLSIGLWQRCYICVYYSTTPTIVCCGHMTKFSMSVRQVFNGFPAI